MCNTTKLSESITELKLTCGGNFFQWALFKTFDRATLFRRSFTSMTTTVVHRARNIIKLYLVRIHLNDEFCDAVCQLPRLSHLRLSQCDIEPRSTMPLMCPVEHLTASLEDINVMYNFMAKLPRLRWYNSRRSDGLLDVSALSNLISTLERIVLSNISDDNMESLRFLLASSVTRLPLTHLKMSTRTGDLKLTNLLNFIPALSHTSLQYLSIEVEGHCPPYLLRRIATHAPQLRSLTLVHSTGYQPILLSGTKAKRRWPCAMQSYIAALAGFSRLEYFGWNPRTDILYFPDALPCFEADSYDGAHDLSGAEEEADWLASLSVGFCPSLEFMAFLNTVDVKLYRLRPTITILEGKRAADVRNVHDPDSNHSWPLLNPDLEPSPGW